MSIKVEVDAIEKWDIIERRYKIDWSIPRSKVQIDVAIPVQIGIIADFIEEIKARHIIAKIIVEQGEIEDPAVW